MVVLPRNVLTFTAGASQRTLTNYELMSELWMFPVFMLS